MHLDLFPRPSVSLSKRRQRLSFSEKLYILKNIEENNGDCHNACIDFNISISTANKIIKEFQDVDNLSWLVFNKVGSKLSESPKIISIVSEFVKSTTKPFWAKDVQNRI